MFDNLLIALHNGFSLEALLANFIGVSLGIIFGALPGLTAVMGIALLIPLTFGFPAITAFSALLGLYCGAVYAGSITAILVGTPGTANAAATMLEGPLLTAKGESLKALEMTTWASFIGGIFSCFVLSTVAPQLASFALDFGAPEYFALGLFGLTIVASLSEGALIKGCISACVGLLISMIGMDPISGDLRMTFDNVNLMTGVALVPALVGLYALSQVFLTLESTFSTSKNINEQLSTTKISSQGIKLSDLWLYRKALSIGSIVGTFIGIVPATGGGIASFAAYNEAKRLSKNPEKFGTGALEGIVATESANNAVTGGALIPLLTLGVPGDVVTAVILGALMIQGITPGPLLFKEQGALVYGIFIALFISNLFMLFCGLASIRLFTKILKIPNGILMPLVATLCIIGAFAVNNSNFDLIILIVFGLIGYIFTKAKFPIAPLLLAMILSSIIETNFRRAMTIYNNDYSIFFTRPISAIFIGICIFILLRIIYKEIKNKFLTK